MGFAELQPEYDAAKIITFPVGPEKKPAVKGYGTISRETSRKLAQDLRFKDANIGFCPGSRSKITILDIDSKDEKLLQDMLAAFGCTPVISHTGSGGYHAFYRYNGEGRKVRPDPKLPVDILGGGFAIVPLSRRADGGSYDFIQGGIEDLANLPIMKAPVPNAREPANVGSRNRALFMALKKYAITTPDATEGQLLNVAEILNENVCNPPLEHSEVKKVAGSVWAYFDKGQLWGETQFLPRTPASVLDALTPDAFWLLNKLQAAHWDRDEFIFAVKGFAASLGWGHDRLRKARDELTKKAFIQCVSEGGNGRRDLPIFRFITNDGKGTA